MMLTLKFARRGTKLRTHKHLTADSAVQDAPIPSEVILPLTMHIGAPASPVVAAGDRVRAGQCVAEPQGPISAAIHSPVDGTVEAVEDRPTANGPAPCVVIKADEASQESPLRMDPVEHLTPEAIRERVREAGIVGMGGATFPTAIKLTPPKGSKIDTFILNGAECEPYLTADYRLMKEEPERLLRGIEIVRGIFPDLRRVILAMERSHREAADPWRERIARDGLDLEVVVLPTLYPQGAEKTLIHSTIGREVPPGKLPADVHCLVQNVATVCAIADAVDHGIPLTERIVTVSGGAVKHPGNYRAKIGTPVRELLELAGVDHERVGRVLGGGPMMGKALDSLDVPLTKGNNGITVLTKEDIAPKRETPCIHCGSCLHVCPMALQPILISELARRGRHDDAKEMGALDCIECGACSYICPASVPLLSDIRDSRQVLNIRRKLAAEKES